MTVSGLIGSPSRCFSVPLQGQKTPGRDVGSSLSIRKPKEKTDLLCAVVRYFFFFFIFLFLGCCCCCWGCWGGSVFALQKFLAEWHHFCSGRRNFIIKAMDASYGDSTDSTVFPRINVRDPYKRLGISREASEDEIQAARNFLVQRYAGHKPSLDAIESAHDKIIMQKFYERKNPKINIKKKVREVTQSRVVQAVTSRFRTPSTKFVIKTAVAFSVLGVLTVLFPTEEGPTLQVAISLIATMYFIYDRLKSKIRAVLYGAGAFAFSWLLGTFLMVSVVPPLFKGLRGFEVTTSLISYILLWVASTYLK